MTQDRLKSDRPAPSDQADHWNRALAYSGANSSETRRCVHTHTHHGTRYPFRIMDRTGHGEQKASIRLTCGLLAADFLCQGRGGKEAHIVAKRNKIQQLLTKYHLAPKLIDTIIN